MASHRTATFNDTPYTDPNPLPSSIPHVDELGVTSAPLKSASFFIGAHCQEVNGRFKCHVVFVPTLASSNLDHTLSLLVEGDLGCSERDGYPPVCRLSRALDLDRGWSMVDLLFCWNLVSLFWHPLEMGHGGDER